MSGHWDSQWQRKMKLITEFGGIPYNFRSTELVHLIDPSLRDPALNLVKECCDRVKIPEGLRFDTLIGEPKYKHRVGGQWVTHISLQHAYFANTIALLIHRGPLSVLEIGAGFGGLSATLERVLDIDRYAFVDAEPCLLLQQYFTDKALDGIETFFFLPHEKWPFAPDLVISTHAFDEMDDDERCVHFAAIQDNSLDGMALYSVNLRDLKMSNFGDYPFDQRWHHKLVRQSLCNEDYVELFSARDSAAMSPHPDTLL